MPNAISAPHRKKIATEHGSITFCSQDPDLVEQVSDLSLLESADALHDAMQGMDDLGVTRFRRRRVGPFDVTTIRGAVMIPSVHVTRASLSVGTTSRALLLHRHRGAPRVDVYFTTKNS